MPKYISEYTGNIVDAVQVPEGNFWSRDNDDQRKEISDFLGGVSMIGHGPLNWYHNSTTGCVIVHNQNQFELRASPGTWILKYPHGDYEVCGPVTFGDEFALYVQPEPEPESTGIAMASEYFAGLLDGLGDSDDAPVVRLTYQDLTIEIFDECLAEDFLKSL